MKKLILILKFLLYEWILVLIASLKILIRRCKQINQQKEEGHRPYSASTCCVPLKSRVYRRPDPTIYDQYYLMALGIAVTWDNPDIQLYRSGQPVSSEDLAPDTEYQVIARIWNNSTEASAAGLPVRLSYLSFGIGTTLHYITSTEVNLGVKGGAHCPVYAAMNWVTPKISGHYCLQVDLIWPDDANPLNNLGQENTHVGTASSPANFTFQLRNPDKKAHAYHFDTDSYAIRKKDPCKPDGDGKMTAAQKWQRQLEIGRARNDVKDFPVPAGWSVVITPEEAALGPEEETTINVSIEPPAGFTGSQAVNIHGIREDRSLAGGVTLYVRK